MIPYFVASSLAEPLRIPEKEVYPITLASAKALLEAVSGDRLEALFGVALALGSRQSEALGLKWRDVDLESDSLSMQRTLQRINGSYQFFETKTKNPRRTIPLPKSIIAALRKHSARQIEDRLKAGPVWLGNDWHELVFTDELRQPLSGFRVTRRFQNLIRLAGPPPMRYHDLRHGAACLMAAQGVPPRVAMEILGHADITTTMNKYSHVAPEVQREAIETVGASLWGDS